MNARRLIPIALALHASCAVASSPTEHAPALQMVSSAELVSPLAVELLNPPAELGGVEDFRRLWRDPRFPSVLMRRHGATYAAFRRSGPIPIGRTRATIPSDVVYFVGRPTEAEIAAVWPDAVRTEPSTRVDETARPVPLVTHTVVREVESATPRMAHMPTRARRLQALASKYAPAE